MADHLRAVYKEILYNPATGWMGWWRSQDGELHDLWAPMPTSIAVMYGIIDIAEGKPMLDQLWDATMSTGFNRFDLGIPLTLKPVRKGDYSIPAPGSRPERGLPSLARISQPRTPAALAEDARGEGV